MSKLPKGLALKGVMTFLAIACFRFVLLAQEEGSGAGSGSSVGSGSSSTTTTTKTVTVDHAITHSPWVWIVGALVLLLLLSVLFRRSKSATNGNATV